MDIHKLKRDSASLENGMWVDGLLGPDLKPLDGLRLKVRGTGSDHFTFALSRRQIEAEGNDLAKDGTILPEAMLHIRLDLLHSVILLDWEGIEGEAGTPIAYDPDLAREWCTNGDYRDFQNLVYQAAGMVNEKVREKTEAAAGN